MRHITFLLFLAGLFPASHHLSAQSYATPDANKERVLGIQFEFDTRWMYFRMLQNPLIPNEKKYVDGSRARPSDLFPLEKIYSEGYLPEIKISKWGKSKGSLPSKTGINQFVDLGDCCGFYLVEKADGYTAAKRAFMTDSLIDRVHLDIYDSIFPYDNRFLVKYLYTDKKSFSERFSFHGGNAEWGDWRETGFMHEVDIVGYFRGVQFGIEDVFRFRFDFSEKIRKFRPSFPDYVYTCNARPSLLSRRWVIIGAPKGREDQLVEYIYYTNLPAKTGDADKTHYYEMRYVLPTVTESVKERRLEKRRLTDEEQKYILDNDNKMGYFIDFADEPDEEIIIERKK